VLLAASDSIALTIDGYAQIVLGGVCTLCLIGGISGLWRRTFSRVIPWPPLTE
jgi:hypothetical protein